MKYEAARAGYINLWERAEIRPEKLTDVQRIAIKLVRFRPQYDAVAALIGCPWWFIACIHQLESGANFTRHLHNGDPLTARTKQVPAGRPAKGLPPFTWTASALDALRMHGLDEVPLWDLPRALYELERYNGWGYLGKTNSPYLWSFTTLYDRGKYIADHVWSATAVSQQCGAAAILKVMFAQGLATFSMIPEAPPSVPSVLKPVKTTPAPVPEPTWIEKVMKFFREIWQ